MSDLPQAATEREVAERFGVSEPDFRSGLTYPVVSQATGLTYEMTLPAGTIITISGRQHALTAPTVVRSAFPCVVIEGTTNPSMEADWPDRILMRLVENERHTRRRVALVSLDRSSLP